MITNILLSSLNVASGNIVPLGVAAGLQLNDGGTSGAFQIQPVSLLGALQGLNGSTGFVAATASGTAAVRTLTSASTIGFTNPAGIAGNPIIDVINNTNTQKVIVSNSGTTVGTRHQVNLIQGSGVTLTVADNSVSDRVDVTIASSSSGSAIQAYDQSVNTSVTYATSIAASGKGSFTFGAPSTNLLALLNSGGAGTLVVKFDVDLALLYTGSLPANIIFDLYTDANPPSGALTAYGTVVSTTSTIAGTTSVTIAKPLSGIFNAGATVLVLWVSNPDALNAMGVQNFGLRAEVSYLPNGYN